MKKRLERRNIYDFSSIKRAARKFHVSLSRAKKWQRNVLHLQGFFTLIVRIDFFFAFLVAVTG